MSIPPYIRPCYNAGALKSNPSAHLGEPRVAAYYSKERKAMAFFGGRSMKHVYYCYSWVCWSSLSLVTGHSVAA